MARPRQPAKQYPRTARVNEVVLEVLADELEQLSDPRVGFVTLTGVAVSPDLRHADVYYSVLGTAENHTETAAGLVAAGPHLRAVLGRQVRLKYLPELRFHEDPAVETGQRIEAIIRGLHRDEAGGR
ncbi:MAG: 30S ribosome-binding factor RbfA [Actinobacteria bacterium]|nr:30S ribosome-binding factor RbfA [Actinomycetota bacterium]